MGKIIQRVKIINGSESDGQNEGNLIWPRILEIQTANGTFKTPTKIVTSQELSSKTKLGLELDIPGNISLFDRGSLNYDKIDKLMNDPGNEGTFIRELRKHKRNMNFFPLRMMHIYPSVSDYPKKDKNGDPVKDQNGKQIFIKSGLTYLANDEQRCLKFIDLLKEILNKTQFDIMAVPTLTNDTIIQKKLFKSAIESIDLGTINEAIPVLNMKQAPQKIESMLDYLLSEYVSTGLIKGIAFQNSFSDSAVGTRALIGRKLLNEEIFIPILSIRKYYPRNKISGINKQAIYFGDSFAPNFIRGYKIKEEENVPEEAYEPYFLRSDTLEMIKAFPNGPESVISSLISEFKNIFPSDSAEIDRIIQSHTEHANLKEINGSMSAIARVHYAIYSEKALINMKNRILKNEFDEYKKENVKLFTK